MRAINAAVCLAILGLVAGESINDVVQSGRHLTGKHPKGGLSVLSIIPEFPPIPPFLISRFQRDVRGLFRRSIPAQRIAFRVERLERDLTPELSDLFANAFVRARQEFVQTGVLLGADLSGDITREFLDSVEQIFMDTIVEKFPSFVFPASFPGVFRGLPDAVFQVIVNSPTASAADPRGIIALVSAPIATSLVRILRSVEPALPAPTVPVLVPSPVPSVDLSVFVGGSGVGVEPPTPTSTVTTTSRQNGVSTVNGVQTVPGPVSVTTVTPTSSNTVTAASTSNDLGSTGAASSSAFTTGGTGLPSIITTSSGGVDLDLTPFQSGSGKKKHP